jgi:hypothetical protein
LTLDQHIQNTLAGRTAMSLVGWPDHVSYWLNSDLARRGDLLLLKFEDLRGDPHETLRQLLDFLGLAPTDLQLAAAIENNNVRRMREKEDRAPSTDIAPGDTRFPWVGEGAVMGWRSKLSDEQVAVIESKMGDMLARLGYPIGSESESG